MYKFKEDNMKVPCMVWAENGAIEESAIEQIKNVSSLPFVYHHVSLMPDAHFGYGCPIGTVAALDGVIIPNLIGVDIGCGMCAKKTNIRVEDLSTEKLKKIMGEIRKRVPVGFNHRKEQCDKSEMPKGILTLGMDTCNSTTPICTVQYSKARYQLGTLGGGNHFIEIQKGDDGYVWIMIHSGSRNLGLQVAKHYNDIAKKLNSKWYSSVSKSQDLAFLPVNTPEAHAYIEEMNYCLDFAYNNRKKMMSDVIASFYDVLYEVGDSYEEMGEPIINIHHNYAAVENHFGKNVVVHRKGATSAEKGEIGIIPGSQGTCSYIVEGLGNPESFKSCSHGAGRLMGRKDAQRRLDLDEQKKILDDKGIVHAIRSDRDLDEAPGAYKDIDVVMENQKDLVKILVKLEPMGVIKG